MARVVVTGPRDEKRSEFVWDKLDEFNASDRGPITELGQGEARGVDAFCKQWAKDMGIPTRDYEADWDQHDEAAGAIRNGEMLEDFKPDYVLVFPRGGPGTTDCARQARKMGFERVFIKDSLDPFEELSRWG